MENPKEYLFVDIRHIIPFDLTWRSPSGETLPLINPPKPMVRAYAEPGLVPHGIRLEAQPATKTDPLPKGAFRGWSRVIFENGTYRTWSLKVEYPQGQDFGSYSKKDALSVGIVYSESKDGFEWTTRSQSTIQTPGRTSFDGFTVFVDPKGPSSERYKAVFIAYPPVGQEERLFEKYRKVHPRYRDQRILERGHPFYFYAAVSPDGLNWKGVPEPLIIHCSDTDTSVYYDAWLDRYVMYTRLYPYERRIIGRAETEDFYHWGPVQPLIWPGLEGALSDDIYTNGRTEYPGLPNYHLMFPMVYHRYTQTSDVYLYSSPDGICWNKVPREPVLCHGTPGQWDSEYIIGGKDLVPFGKDRIAIPYYGTSFPHKYPRWQDILDASRSGWAWWPKGRLCAVVADEEGSFATFHIVPAGRQLRLNVNTSYAGEVRVGLYDQNWQEVPGRTISDCDPISGDNLGMPVHWKGEADIGVKEGQPIVLHFKLRAAKLFSFEWV